ncbi:MAG: threonine aldolase family protein [Nocardioides sp.]
MIDLRSDTVTRPTEAMRAAMARAEVGDDVYAEDPTVLTLQERVAELFGVEAALFTPTGSMANLLAVRSLADRGQEVLCESSAHIARAELGAHAAYTGVTMRTWTHPRGQVDLAALRALFAPDTGPFFVRTAAVSVENTHNFAGGAVLPLADLQSLREWADGVGTRVHLDGARIWNAHVATGLPLREYAAVADAMAVCLSKGLGAPVGSLVLGPADAIAEARVWRKRMGGGMRQVGVLAAAGLHALDHHVERLADDHAHARLLAEACGVDPATVDTNIVVVERADATAFVAAARAGRAGRDGGADDGAAGHAPGRQRSGRPDGGVRARRALRSAVLHGGGTPSWGPAGSAGPAEDGELADGGEVPAEPTWLRRRHLDQPELDGAGDEGASRVRRCMRGRIRSDWATVVPSSKTQSTRATRRLRRYQLT